MIEPFEVQVRIYYEDTDCGGVVYYANYLRYFERVRTAHLESLGIDLVSMMREGQFFVVTSAEIQYHRPGQYGDMLRVQSIMREIGGASLTFAHTVLKGKSSEILVTARVRLAAINQDGKIMRFAGPMLQRLKASPSP